MLNFALAQCLYVLSDDNYPAISELRPNSSYTSCLVVIAQGPAHETNGKAKDEGDERFITLRVLSAGILRNISPLPSMSTASTIDLEKEVILPLLQPILASTSLHEEVQKVQEIVTRQVRSFNLALWFI